METTTDSNNARSELNSKLDDMGMVFEDGQLSIMTNKYVEDELEEIEAAPLTESDLYFSEEQALYVDAVEEGYYEL